MQKQVFRQINLPMRLEVSDYHEFDYIQDYLKQIIPGIKVKELGFAAEYLGIAYLGSLKDSNVKELVKEIEKEIKEWE